MVLALALSITLAQAPVPEERESVAALKARVETLRRSRPSIAGPVTLLSVGGGVTVLGALYALVGLVAVRDLTSSFSILGLVGLGLGTVLAGVGGVNLHYRLRDRQAIDEELQITTARLRALEGHEEQWRRDVGPGVPQVMLTIPMRF